MNIGAKIKSLRIRRGLTQKQLASGEMTRELVSLIENGKCNPSLDTIRIISRKLGVSPDCFLSDADHMGTVEELLHSANECLKANLPNQSLERATKALEMCNTWNSEEHMCHVHACIGESYEMLNDRHRAIDAFEMALQRSIAKADRLQTTRYLFRIANNYFHLEDYEKAARYYSRLISLTEGSKKLQHTNVSATIYLGSCHYRLGELALAREMHAHAQIEAKRIFERKLEIEASLGLGGVLYKSGDCDGAIRITETAVGTSRECNNHLLPHLLLNLGIYYSQQRKWDSALTRWNSCIEYCTTRGEWVLMASALEEISRYHLYLGETEKAKEVLLNALDVLDRHENRLLRARIYRGLADLTVKSGACTQALDLYRLSIFLFRSVGAAEEIRVTEQHLRVARENNQAYAPSDMNK